jgi:hypothetical protein
VLLPVLRLAYALARLRSLWLVGHIRAAVSD